MKQKKKVLSFFIVILAIAIILMFFYLNQNKTDDWKYNSDTQYILNEISVFIIPIIYGVVFIVYTISVGVYNLKKGKKLENTGREKTGRTIIRINNLFIPILILAIISAVIVDTNILVSAFLEILAQFLILTSIATFIVLILYNLIIGIKRKLASCIIFSILVILSIVIGAITIRYFSMQYASSLGISSSTNGTLSLDSAASTSSIQSFSASSSTSSSDVYLGFSTGGAKDINNFRENIKEGYFPISTDITYNGIFYDYTFDTSREQIENTEDLFYPTYSCAKDKDPVSGEEEYYLSVGLNSNIKESDFKRKKLNLTILLDISGSMSSSFDKYYYDNLGETTLEDNKSKMQIANEAVNILIDRLEPEDRFGMVLFDDRAYLAKPMNLVSKTDMESIKGHILEIIAQGGTNFSSGYKKATELYNSFKTLNSDEYENRIIVLTDAMPNYGTTTDEGLLSMVEENANNGIYTTFIGVGVDFNTELVNLIGSVRGANYYSVHNSEEFKTRMGEQFEYMVTPLVFDLNLKFDSESFEIEKVYGSDKEDALDGNLMEINTLFPSPTTDTGEVKGGITVLKLKKKLEDIPNNIRLTVSYKDRNGKEFTNDQEIVFENKTEDYYDNTGIRKAIALVRYVNTIKNWILYERTESPNFIILPNTGIMDCDFTRDEIKVMLGRYERTSTPLSVSENYKKIFSDFKQYFSKEITELKDENLNQEIEILDMLINFK